MGEVYVAEQTEPVCRKVALKIIRPGMASKDVLARFEAERQALAMMDHPNIARIFDGGACETGQKLTERTVYTNFSRMIGTPLYMSPEQAELGVVDMGIVHNASLRCWDKDVNFSPDGKQVASVSRDGTLRLWNASTGQGLEPRYERTTTQLSGP
jgi:serine/threonine protein kinase